MQRFQSLVSFLREHAPNDLLMPVRRSTKIPMFAHSRDQWSWDRLDSFSDNSEEYDAGVILHDLCVIDVDTQELCAELESMFPELLEVPTEETRRGRHYWFRRSQRANSRGFYDGAGQIHKGVDFKTRCATGTGGLILVAPSTGKSFLRPLDKETLVEIPDRILDAVAVATVLSERTFIDIHGVEFQYDSTLKSVRSFQYIEPFFEEFAGCAIPLPCTERQFRLAMSLVEDNCKLGDQLEEALIAADVLGLSSAATNRLFDSGKRLYELALARNWPGMLSEDVFAVDDKVFNSETHTKDFERFGTLLNFALASRVSCAKFEGVESGTPAEVLDLLKKHPNLLLAGGGPLSIVTNAKFDPNDWDFFLHGVNKDQASDVMNQIYSDLKKTGFQCYKTDRAWTFVRSSSSIFPSIFKQKRSKIVIQVILKLHETPEDVLRSFDIAPCQSKWSRSSILRIYKYALRGFRVYFPGVDRSCLTECNSNFKDLRGIFYIETKVNARKRHINNLRFVRKLLQSKESYYDEQHFKTFGIFSTLLKTIQYSDWPWGTQVSNENQKICWRFSSNMDPLRPNFRSLHNAEQFHKAALEYMFFKQS
ncbi:hypothetical protein CEUSTIGMA_g10740.t1 [Chlamydomonas eustigma]|uniref:DNA primase/polymerase bifunctional N-terminal domain-containing protein n=1 Tax=Chlamydomonas eustigma TaxID=1157962 RepID=A0A250XJR3_9CHLO|nr:hypothetical protein CEUSTIGMA_g10740.t1 [Chlamydomonas eustigma]|eukprot:GAX83314.1 hypothetical protein CEUSTIGMA_g10740.t1 [Chlamydomonas eustigma]